jgi:proteasome lid subunit RPN8/RPN11
LVDFLELTNSNMNNKDIVFDNLKDLIRFLQKESESSLMAELCSMIGLDKNNKIVYTQMQNRSKDPETYFMIDPYDYLAFINKYSCLCVFHSHLIGDEKPSEFDEKTSENCCYPFLIYSINTEKFYIYEPEYKDYDVNIIQRLKELI